MEFSYEIVGAGRGGVSRRQRRRWSGRAAAVAAFAVAAAACATFRSAPPLPHVSSPNPVVIVPGILGSRLEDSRDGSVVWGRIFGLRAFTVHETLIRGHAGERDGLELPIASRTLRKNRDHLVAAGILDRFTVIPRVAEVEAYGAMLEAFEVCGYQPGTVASCGLNADAAVLPYDWRRDVVESAQELGAAIRRIRDNAGDPATPVDLVAHSMGGLVVEYYLLYGEEDVLEHDPLPPPTYAGASGVRRVVLLGVPHLGSVEALTILHEGYRVGWRSISPEATFTMPSLYQLLPPESAVRVAETGGRDAGADLALYDGRTWPRYGLSVFSPEARRAFLRRCKVLFPDDWRRQSDDLYSGFEPFLDAALTRAGRLRRALAPFAERPAGPQVYLVGSAAHDTAATAELRHKGGGWRLDAGPTAPGGTAPGDGTVTAASFTWGGVPPTADADRLPATAGPGYPVTWVDEDHSRLPQNRDALRRIAEILAG